MKTGRPPKPTKIRILEGNPGRRPLNRNEPQPTEGVPTRPQFLSPEAKREWMRIVPELEKMGLLTLIDRAKLTTYCRAWGEYVKYCKYLDEFGETYEMTNGAICQRPQVSLRKDAIAIINQFGSQFGLDPSSRSRINIPGGKEEDTLDAILRGAG